MKTKLTKYSLLIVAAMVVLAGVCIVPAAADDAGQAPYALDHILVRFQDNADSDSILAASPAPVGILRDFSDMISGLQVIQLPEGFSVEDAVAYYSSLPGVVYAEPDYCFTALSTAPNDPGYAQQWGLKNPSSQGGVSAEAAWDITTGDDSIIVAVIDSGVNIEHPDLEAHIWTNPGEIPGNGIDDDHNRYVDDVHGWNFILNSNDLTDYKGHGTHCAGIIGAVANNNEGVAGTAWDVTIMPVAVLDAAGHGYGSSVIDGIIYAVMNNADILSISIGGHGPLEQAYQDAIDFAEKNGVLIVAAAGNDGSDNDVNPTWPSSFQNDNIIAVAASNNANEPAYFSNYGKTSVDIAAPGVAIYSTYPEVSKTPGNLYPTENPHFNQLGDVWKRYQTDGYYEISGKNSSVIYYTEPITPAGLYFSLVGGIAYQLSPTPTPEKTSTYPLQYLVSTQNFSKYGSVQDMLNNQSDWFVFLVNLKTVNNKEESWSNLWSRIQAERPSDEYYVGIYYNATNANDWAKMYYLGINNDYSVARHIYYNDSGTSMAAPMVSGAAALVKSVNPNLTPSQIREIFIETADRLPAWNGKVVSNGRLNIAAAVEAALPARGHSPSLPKEYTTPSYVEPMVQQTTTPTAQPTPTPAAPTVMPTAKPTQTQKSPAPLAGLIAGLGAAALVLARMRR